PSALAQLSDRPWLFALDPTQQPSAAQASFPDFTRAVLVVDRDQPPRTAEDREEFDRAMETQGFALTLDDRADGVALYSRGVAEAVSGTGAEPGTGNGAAS
ncbi:MAG: hypothetical protein OEW29_14385, partial [Acidimicrobiia bacterium]|nr:hypothetical protein [Acidimicrobiia bacterium]